MSGKLRILPLGGCGEIGKNMTVVEYEDEIVIIDAGIMFPENDMLGVDAIIPDFKYLLDKWERVKGVLITHGTRRSYRRDQPSDERAGRPDLRHSAHRRPR